MKSSLEFSLEELEEMERAMERLRESELFVEKHIVLSEEAKKHRLQ